MSLFKRAATQIFLHLFSISVSGLYLQFYDNLAIALLERNQSYLTFEYKC